MAGLIAFANTSTAQETAKRPESRMSAAGRLARQHIATVTALAKGSTRNADDDIGRQPSDCADDIRCFPNSPTVGLGGTQAEVSVAVDSTGQHIVLAFNDFRGFAKDPVSLSGFMFSDDGGAMFTDGGQLPSPGNQSLFGQKWPQILGDPDVQYLGGCNFIYLSLMDKVVGTGLV